MTADLISDFARSHLYASAMILLVLAARRPVRERYGARVAYVLWLLPVLGAGVAWLPGRVERVAAAPSVSTASAEPFADPGPLWADGPAQAVEAAFPAFTLPQITFGLWSAGVGLSLLWLAVQQTRVRRFARAGAFGPAVMGAVRPRVVLPVDFEERYDAAERALILEHEVTHLRRQDPRVIGVAVILRSLAWFNPLAYVAVRRLRIDQELACDETVVTRFPDARRAYARALAKSQLADRPLPLGCYWPSGTRHPLLERIAMLKTNPVDSRRRTAGAAALVLLCGASGMAAWAANPVDVIYEGREAAPTEVAAAPLPQPPAAAKAKAPEATAPAPQAAETPAALPAEVCLNNGCGETSKPMPEVAPDCSPFPGCRVDYVGPARIRSYTAFAKYYDGNKPLMIQGRVVEVRMTDGLQAELIVEHGEDGKRFRVTGGDSAGLTPEARAIIENSVGSTVAVRGYQAFDTSCEGGGCLMNGRLVTRPDGSPFIPGGPTAPPSPAPPTAAR
jgi:beta-lactamase regulating signal transducer with metallopeptidase domain